jgi:hypothetical protein
MISIYELDHLGQWTGAIAEIDEADGCPPIWARAPNPPEVGLGEVAVWAVGRWYVLDRLELSSPPEPGEPLNPSQSS